MYRFFLIIALLYPFFTEGNSAGSVCVVDLKRVHAEAEFFAKAHEKFSHKREKFELELKEQERKLATTEEALRELKKQNSPDYEPKRKAFELSLQALYAKLQKRKISLKRTFEKELVIANKHLEDILQKISESKNIEIILSKEDILFVRNGVDITQDVIDMLNKKKTGT